MAESSGIGGPAAALKNIATTLLATVQTRLALLSNEVQVEKLHALQQLGLALSLMFCLGLTVLLAVALAVFLWFDNRLWVLGGFTCVFASLAGYFYVTLQRSLADSEPLFAASLAELQEDLRQLRAATGHDKKSA